MGIMCVCVCVQEADIKPFFLLQEENQVSHIQPTHLPRTSPPLQQTVFIHDETQMRRDPQPACHRGTLLLHQQ